MSGPATAVDRIVTAGLPKPTPPLAIIAGVVCLIPAIEPPRTTTGDPDTRYWETPIVVRIATGFVLTATAVRPGDRGPAPIAVTVAVAGAACCRLR